MTGQSRVEVTGGFLLLVAWLNYLDRSFVVASTSWGIFLSSAGWAEL